MLWGDDISILDSKRFNHRHIHSPRHLTDLYLLGLAVRHKGRLASFDQRIPLSAVVGATAAHLVTLLGPFKPPVQAAGAARTGSTRR